MESSWSPITTKNFTLESGQSWLDLVGLGLESNWSGLGWARLGWVSTGLQWTPAPPGWISNGVAGLQWSPIRQVGECEVLTRHIGRRRPLDIGTTFAFSIVDANIAPARPTPVIVVPPGGSIAIAGSAPRDPPSSSLACYLPWG